MVNDNELIENSILCFLHHYPEHHWAVDYAKLLEKVRALKDEQPKDAEVRKRGRPAKRQRKKEATGDTPGKEENKTT